MPSFPFERIQALESAFGGRQVLEPAHRDGTVLVGPGAEGAESVANKDQPSGYAGLDAATKLKLAELPNSVANGLRTQALLTARGLLTETIPKPTLSSQSGTLTSGRVFLGLVYLFVGEVVTNLVIAPTTASSGTAPTLCRMGLLDSTGKVVATTAAITAFSATGETNEALTSPGAYTVASSGFFWIAILVNGTWSVTQPQFLRGTSTGISGALVALSGKPAVANLGAAASEPYADLPAVNSTLTLQGPTGNAMALWLGCN